MLTSSLVSLGLGLVTFTADPPAQSKVREAVGRSLDYMQAEAVSWINIRKCASCHHAPMMIWAVREANARGYEVDQAALDEVTNWTLNDPVVAKALPAPRKPGEKPGPGDLASLPSTY